MSALPHQGLTFRAMTEQDLDKVLEIERQAHIVPWSFGIFHDCLRVNYVCELLEHGEELLGYVVMSIAVGEAHVFNICVAPAYQKQGYGRLLMNRLVDVARDRNATTIFLEVRPSNKSALTLYDKIGFVEVGVRKAYYPSAGGREDAIILAREL